MSNTQKIVMVLVLLLIYGIVVFIVLTFGNHLPVDDSFENAPGSTVKWYCDWDGDLKVDLVSTVTKHGEQAARLGEPVPQTPRSQREHALLYRTMVIPNYERPVLTFWYRMFANDTMDFSDFQAYLLSSDGITSGIKRDGFRTCEFDKYGSAYAPPAEFDLGWRMASYDLNGFQLQEVTLVFVNSNLYTDTSMGIWTYVDDVRVVDAGPSSTPPGPYRAYLPMVMKGYATCDPIPTQVGIMEERPIRPPTPVPP